MKAENASTICLQQSGRLSKLVATDSQANQHYLMDYTIVWLHQTAWNLHTKGRWSSFVSSQFCDWYLMFCGLSSVTGAWCSVVSVLWLVLDVLCSVLWLVLDILWCQLCDWYLIFCGVSSVWCLMFCGLISVTCIFCFMVSVLWPALVFCCQHLPFSILWSS